MEALNEIIEYLKNFLTMRLSANDAWFFSYELPEYISERYNDVEVFSPIAARMLNDDVIDLCAALDEEDIDGCISEKTFRKKLGQSLEQLRTFIPNN